MDLSEFLLARIAEDEAVAKAATPGPWQDQNGYVTAPGVDVQVTDYGSEDLAAQGEDSPHIARWNPARVLAECDAKRRIVELHRAWPVLVEQQPQLDQSADLQITTLRLTQQIAWLTQEEFRKRFGSEPPTAPMLRALALLFADHPDYDPEWRP